MRIAFLGDIAFLGQFDKKIHQDAEQRLKYLKEELSGYDYIIANLETPLTSRNSTMICKSMHLKSDPCNVELLKYLNISAVSLANNHIADFGISGLEETITILDREEIQWFGVKNQYLDLTIEHEKIHISGFCCYSSNGTHYGRKGINLLTLDNLKKQLLKDKSEGAFSIVSIHWGMEHTNYPAYEHVQLMDHLLKNHEAVVCGHHPHMIQGIKEINKSLVAYSLGNAVFDTCVSRNHKLKVELNDDNRKCFYLGVNIQKKQIMCYKIKGFYIGENGIEQLDIKQFVDKISDKLEIEDLDQYNAMRKEQFSKAIQVKFGKHDLNWLFNRMNYYAVGAYIMGHLRNAKYKKEAEKFING